MPSSALTGDGKNIKAGSLAVSNTGEIIQNINCMIQSFSSKKLPVFFSLDWHAQDHCSFSPTGTFNGPLVNGTTTPEHLCEDPRTRQDFNNPNLGVMQWPKHCVQQTFGSRFYPYLKVPQNAKVIKKGSVENLDAYSAFNGYLSKQSFPFDTQDTACDLKGRSTLVTLLK